MSRSCSKIFGQMGWTADLQLLPAGPEVQWVEIRAEDSLLVLPAMGDHAVSEQILEPLQRMPRSQETRQLLQDLFRHYVIIKKAARTSGLLSAPI